MAPSAAPLQSDTDDDDPITAEYDVYITPVLGASPPPQPSSTTSSSTNKPQPQTNLYLLQHPTRDRAMPYNAASGAVPSELRLKPNTGFLELDVPISSSFYYDKPRAKEWGSALAKAKSEGAGGFGLSAGFAQNAAVRAQAAGAAARGTSGSEAPGSSGGGSASARASRGRSTFGASADDDNDHTKMIHQTLGGQIIPPERGQPRYMIGAFRGSELHLTPLTGLVQMRPQFHHLDALTQVERNAHRRSANAAAVADGTARTAEPRLVQMSAKGSADPESMDGPTGDATKKYLAAAQEEGWTKLRYTDEDEEEAYTLYHEMLFLGEEDKSVERSRELQASISNDRYLDAISAPRLDPSGGKRILRPMRKRASKTGSKEESWEEEDVEAMLSSPVLTKKSPTKVKKEKGKERAVDGAADDVTMVDD